MKGRLDELKREKGVREENLLFSNLPFSWHCIVLHKRFSIVDKFNCINNLRRNVLNNKQVYALKKIPDNKGLEDFLKPSELCDSDNPLIKSAAEEITEKAKTPKEAAIEIFYFVRDKIPLAFVNPSKTASDTLRIGKGSCFTKATLQMALLRSVGIPARFRIMKFRGNDPEEWEGILPSLAVSMMPEQFPHYLVEVYIEGRWVMADATFDKSLISEIEDWNGEEDVCSIEDRAILSDMGAFAFIEEEARKLDELYRVPAFLSMNSYRFFWILNLYLKVQRLKNKL